MATRFRLPNSGTAAISPTPATEWDFTTGVDYLPMVGTRKGDAATSKTVTDSTATANRDALARVYVSPPLAAQTITGTVKGQLRVQEGSTASNLRSQCIIRVIASDGSTVRGTLYAGDTTTGTSNPTSEWATSLTNIKMPRGGATTLSSVTAVDGDRIVVEIGYRKHAAASTTGTFSFGDPSSTDLAEDETTTTANTPWIEFSQDLIWSEVATGGPDAFTGTNGTALTTYSSNWSTTSINGSGTAAIQIQSNRASRSGNAFALDTWNARTPASADYDVEGDITFVASAGSSFNYSGVTARFVSGTGDYSIVFNPGSTWILLKNESTTLASWTDAGMTTGTTKHAVISVWGSQIRGIIDGVVRMVGTDSTLTAAGAAGMLIGADTPASQVDVDNWTLREDVSTTPVSGSDSGTISATEAQTVLASLLQTDSGTISVSEAQALLASLLQTDSGTVSASEAQAVTQKFTGSDSGTISATESQTLTILTAVSDSDSGTVSDAEAQTVLASLLQTDSGTISATEAASIVDQTTATDSATVSATEAQAVLRASAVADSGTISAVETQALTQIYTSSDSGTVSASEAQTLLAASTQTDSGTVSATEVGYTILTQTGSDSGTISAVESAVVTDVTQGARYRSKISTTVASSSSISMSSLPSGTVDGWLLLALVSCSTATPSSTPPSGWTAYGGRADPSGFAHIQGFYKIWHTGDATTATFNLGAATAAGLIVAAFSGVDPTTPMDVTPTVADAGAGGGTSLTTASITPVTTGSLLVSAIGGSAGVAGELTKPTTMVQIDQVGGAVAAMAYETWPGGSITRTWNSSNTDNLAVSMAALRSLPVVTPVSAGDAGTISAVETAVLTPTFSPAPSDSGTISATEAQALQRQSTQADAATITAVETVNLIRLVVADSGTISATESASIIQPITSSDSGTISAVETQSIQTVTRLTASDAGTISAVESQTVVVIVPIHQTDSGTISAVESIQKRTLTPTFSALII